MTITSEFTCPTFIPVNGVTLEVFEAGRHNRGNPIVMCHGWPELAYSWRDQIPALVDAGYHVIGMKNPEAPDMTLERKNGV